MATISLGLKCIAVSLAIALSCTSASAATPHNKQIKPVASKSKPANTVFPKLFSSSVMIQDQKTGKTIFAKNAADVRPIASITKLMTAMVVLDAKLPMNERIAVTSADVDRIKHSSSRLAVGTTLPRKELLKLALMSSENRAAHALARTYPGGVPAFVKAMNRKARAMGLSSMRFADPTGLSAHNVSNSQDLATMVGATMSYRVIRDFSTERQDTVSVAKNKQVFRNTNPLVRQGRWDINVSKTGYINEAGRCLVMQAIINNRPTLIVLLDAENKEGRLQDAQTIKRWLESPNRA